MEPQKSLEVILGFEIPLHKEFTKSFGRPIIDFPVFLDKYYEQYGKVGFYGSLNEVHGEKAALIRKYIDELT